MDPLAGSSWSSPGTVSGFAASPPNEVLLRVAADALTRPPVGRALDIGCGAARNAVPLAQRGWQVFGTDLSWPMLVAAKARADADGVASRLQVTLAPMEALPVTDGSIDLVIAHGIWNLAPSSAVFRRAVREARRAARTGATLFVFTFSRHTIPDEAEGVAGEPFVYTQFSGAPQCFLTEQQLIDEMAAGGFERDPAWPITEYNRPPNNAVPAMRAPVIYEAVFRAR